MSGSYGGGYGRGGGGGRGYDANFQNRGGGGGGGYGGSGYQSGGRVGVDGGRSGGRGGGDGRDGDWVCPEPSCGNLNFARGVECNKCGAPSPTGGAGSYDKGSATNSYNRDGRDYNNRGRDGDYHGRGRGGHNSDAGRFDGNQGGRAGDYSERGAPYGDNRGTGDYGGGDTAFSSKGGGDNDNFSQVPPPAPAYGGSAVNHPTPPNSYGGHNAYGVESIPQPNRVNSLPPTYGAPSTYGGAPAGYSGPTAGYTDRSIPVLEKGGPPRYGGHGGRYGSAPAEAPVAVKQCDANCGDSCDNSRIYISNLPPDVTTDELRDLFGGIGQVGRIKQKKGYKDQWPWNIKIYTDDHGNNKGDAALCYEDPSAAHSAGGFFNEFDMRGYKINVAMAAKSAPRAPPAYGHGRGRGGYGGGRDRRRDNYRDAGGSGPDRKYHGGQRSQPY